MYSSGFILYQTKRGGPKAECFDGVKVKKADHHLLVLRCANIFFFLSCQVAIVDEFELKPNVYQ